MTKRDELIEKAARAICRRRYGFDLPTPIGPYSPGSKLGECMGNATAALDAILEGLADPSEEMARAGHDHIAGDGDLETLFRAMLQPLKAATLEQESKP